MIQIGSPKILLAEPLRLLPCMVSPDIGTCIDYEDQEGMMAIRYGVVDAFTSKPFAGNPAGVVILEQPADHVWMQKFAAEMKYSETAFLIPIDRLTKTDGDWWSLLGEAPHDAPGRYALRWFTPTDEVDLCGHATLASAHFLRDRGLIEDDLLLRFYTRSGELCVEPEGDRLAMNFPSTPPVPATPPRELTSSFTAELLYVGKTKFDWFVELASAEEVRQVRADTEYLVNVASRGLIVTARGDDGVHDVISRGFFPQVGIEEDPVTGSAHSAIGPYWSEKLGKTELNCYQASERGGELLVRIKGDRVELVGHAVTILAGELLVT